jgi:hypothetical protein
MRESSLLLSGGGIAEKVLHIPKPAYDPARFDQPSNFPIAAADCSQSLLQVATGGCPVLLAVADSGLPSVLAKHVLSAQRWRYSGHIARI